METPTVTKDATQLDAALKALARPKREKQALTWKRLGVWFLRVLTRAAYLAWVAASGIVRKIHEDHVREMLKLWAEIPSKLRPEVHEAAKVSSQNRRTSIFENTAKGAMVVSSVAGGIFLLVFALPSAKVGQVVGLVAAVLQLFFSAMLIVWMSAPKLKVWLYKPGRVPAALQQLRNLAADRKFDTDHPRYAGFSAYFRTAETREERDIRLLVDRRMLCLASFLYVTGVFTVLNFYFFAR